MADLVFILRSDHFLAELTVVLKEGVCMEQWLKDLQDLGFSSVAQAVEHEAKAFLVKLLSQHHDQFLIQDIVSSLLDLSIDRLKAFIAWRVFNELL